MVQIDEDDGHDADRRRSLCRSMKVWSQTYVANCGGRWRHAMVGKAAGLRGRRRRKLKEKPWRSKLLEGKR
ncbi:nuclear transport factor 2 family protein [Sesbania bispinosa]|nr:nuclear transport factor 2 family protein [Sesbania bispinosa]